MEFQVMVILWSLFVGAIVSMVLHWFFTSIYHRKKLPPGPIPLPIVSNLWQLPANIPTRSINNLARIHGPLMTLKLGFRTTIVISSAQVAVELSSRSDPDGARCALIMDDYRSSLSCIDQKQQWKDLRKVLNMNAFFTPQRSDLVQNVRVLKLRELTEFLNRCCIRNQVVDIGQVVFTTMINILSNITFSVDFAAYASESSKELKNLIRGMIRETGGSRCTISKFFSVFSSIDGQGNRRKSPTKQLKKLKHLFDEMIEKRSLSSHQLNDGLDFFLSLSHNSKSTDIETIKNNFLDLLIAGIDKSSITVEWAMAELIRNPAVMAKARFEINNIVPHDKKIEDSHISQLPYLKAIVKETLRMHPPHPLSQPHTTQNDVHLGGYLLPKHTQLLFNLRAIGRDTDSWTNPNLFQPERFLPREQLDCSFLDFQQPICSDHQPLQSRMVHLMLASLLHSFDWKLPDGITPTTMDMTEMVGSTMSLAKPLMLLPLQQIN
ncbi:hypothetical protein ZOSMA_34G00190 [Zostera marina]|uniref:Cytochrome P450 n=1 Tax=Zostera marina TaxID=29655 RepID=A0A0K9P6W3_ZOSMR|nr:hypothetical protein ZOSMA_34G00190 [Zostera marina]